MLPQTHKIISEHLHQCVQSKLGVSLNKSSLIYGSIKPDFAPHLLKLDHFKPQSFTMIMDEIFRLSQHSFQNNGEFIKFFSMNIGVVSHFIADFFCLPHNDRVTYRKATIINHIIYEAKLHRAFMDFQGVTPVSRELFSLESQDSFQIKQFIDMLHHAYQDQGGNLNTDLAYSLKATAAIGLFIVNHALQRADGALAQIS